MSSPVAVDLFAEDRAHESLLRALIARIATEEGLQARVRVRSARGGHGRVLTEFRAYQQAAIAGLAGGLPQLMVAAIDANCRAFAAAHREVTDALVPDLRSICVPACPDPHIERWFLADPKAFHQVVGVGADMPQAKCERDLYKHILSQAVVKAGHPPTLGGIEFAADLVRAMDLYRAGRACSSLKHFVDELRGRLKRLS